MTQTEGDKEIVLGNKQLISLFFVVVALLGVFFAAGYMIGRKSGTPAPVPAPDSGSTTGSSPSSSSATSRQESESPHEAASQPDPGPGTIAEAQPEVAISKPHPVVSDTPLRDTPARKSETPRPALKSDPPAKAENTGDMAVTRPESGATYLQVTALRRPDADNLVRSLREQSFPAVLAASSKEGLYRVMVGPYHETAKVAESKSRLKALGFANAFVQK